MTLLQLYKRGYAIGTGARVRNIESGDVYIMANTAEYEWCAINLKEGTRWRDPSEFNCSFQANRDSVRIALGPLRKWESVV